MAKKINARVTSLPTSQVPMQSYTRRDECERDDFRRSNARRSNVTLKAELNVGLRWLG